MARLEQPKESQLESRLLKAALGRLADVPADKLSLRQLAHDLKVSHQAPYVHFGSKRQFLAAVAGLGLEQAAEQAASGVASAPDNPIDRLHALADAYLAFIGGSPHLHDLAYGPAVAMRDHPLLQWAAIAYWNLLHDTVAACQPIGIREEEVLRRSAIVWGSVYGLARLAAFKKIPSTVPGSTHALVHEALDGLYAGWQSNTEHASGGGPEFR